MAKKCFSITIVSLVIILLLSSCSLFFKKYILTVDCDPSKGGTVSISPEQDKYKEGTLVTITAEASDGYEFDHWSGDLEGNENPVEITMDYDKDITANFIEVDKWTVMVYLDADNNLEGAGIEDFNEMESVNLAGLGINLIVLFDRIDGWDSSNGDWTNTRLYEIEYDSGGLNTTINSQRLASSELGLTTTGNEELNMGDPGTVTDFIDFCQSNYSAENYAFIFWNHGGGWRDRSQYPDIIKKNIGFENQILKAMPTSRFQQDETEQSTGFRGVCWDDTSSKDFLYTQEINNGISAKGINVVGFDACFEGMIEVAYEIRNSADYMIASEQTEPGDGWEYHYWLNNFIESEMTQVDLVNSIVDAYETRYSATSSTTLSGLDLSQIENLFTALNSFSTALYNVCTTDTIRDEVRDILWLNTEYYWSVPGDNNIDIWDMADQIYTLTNYADTEASGLKTAVESAVIKEWCNSSGNPDSHGIAIYLTHVNSSGVPDYLAWAYCGDYTGDYPLQFVSNSSNTWVPDSTTEDGLLYRLWIEPLS